MSCLKKFAFLASLHCVFHWVSDAGIRSYMCFSNRYSQFHDTFELWNVRKEVGYPDVFVVLFQNSKTNVYCLGYYECTTKLHLVYVHCLF